MDKEEFDFMEVKPKDSGWFFVTMYQFEKIDPKHPDYIKDWLEFDGSSWIYENAFYVCFIHRRYNAKLEEWDW